LVVVLSGCESRTYFGPCVGVGEDKNPALKYKLSARNTVMALVFAPSVVVPIVVLVNETFCPVGEKQF